MPPSRSQPHALRLADDSLPLALFLVVLLSCLLRLAQLGGQSLWVDEMLTILQGQQVGHSLWEQFLDDYQSPLPMLIVAWMGKLSPSEAWLRLPGAFLASLTPLLLFELGRRTYSARVGVLAALLLAVNPFHVYHAQELRGYAYMLFFGLCATVVAAGARPRLSWRRSTALALLGTATGLCNLQGLVWMGSLALALLVARRVSRADLPRWAFAFAAIVFLLSPWWTGSLGTHEAGRLVPGEETGPLLRGETTFSAWAIPYAGFVLAAGNTVGPTPRELHQRVGEDGASLSRLVREHGVAIAVVGVLVISLGVLGLVGLGARSWVVLSWVALPIAVALLLAARNVKPFNPRYVIAALPAMVLLMAIGIDRLPRRISLLFLSAWLGIQGLGLARYHLQPNYGREDVRAAAQLVQSRESPEDFILAPTVGSVFRYYYRGDNPIRLHMAEMSSSREAIEQRLQELEPERRYLWYVRARAWDHDPDGLLLSSLEGGFRRIALFELPGVELRLYEREAGAR